MYKQVLRLMTICVVSISLIFMLNGVAAAKEGLTAMQRGMIDGYIGSMVYFAGVLPEVNGEWLPFSWKNVSEAMDIENNAF
ncbi:hypothetical protein [Desulfobacula sp.]|uniref:hypothetical protein n=1 Tax=Desulfobacula sp. TaxID=2593537 RepID=UPI00263581CC|nr:hypothetical protein [Desulfobacula sp.]